MTTERLYVGICVWRCRIILPMSESVFGGVNVEFCVWRCSFTHRCCVPMTVLCEGTIRSMTTERLYVGICVWSCSITLRWCLAMSGLCESRRWWMTTERLDVGMCVWRSSISPRFFFQWGARSSPYVLTDAQWSFGVCCLKALSGGALFTLSKRRRRRRG